MLRLGREARVEEDRYDLFFAPVDTTGRSALTFEARERMDAARRAAGRALTEERRARGRGAGSRPRGPSGVAVCFLHSYVNPAHERTVADALRAAMPGTFVVASSEIWPEIREYERAMTTVVCAVVGPVMAGYLDGLQCAARPSSASRARSRSWSRAAA